MKLHRFLVSSATALVMLLTPLTAVAASDDPWEFEGGGWGHGVGLSQFGSQGMALENHTAASIIDYYYNGADIKTLTELDAEDWLSDSEAIWVGLALDKTSRAFKVIGGPVDVCLRGDGSDSCETADLSLKDEDELTVSTVEGSDPLRCEVNKGNDASLEGDCWIDLTWDENPGNTGVVTGGIEYARGSIHIRPNDSTEPNGFHVSVSVDLEKYIYGIAETLLHWEEETLKTQAIIARSYGVNKALSSAKPNGELEEWRKDLCWCHIWSTASDQNYDGWSGGLDTEGDPTYGTKWRQAVKDTAGQVVTHPDWEGGTVIISTFYSSSNGGASENNEDVWPGDPRPWLRSVIDKWSSDPNINPLASWSVSVSDADMAKHFGWDRALDAFVLQGPPNVLVEFTGVENGEIVKETLNGSQIASLLKTYGFGYSAPGSPNSDPDRPRVSPYIKTVTDPPGFDDIVGHLFEADIEWAAEVGITKGCNPPDNTLFCPDEPVSREVMAAFLNRYLGLPAATKDHFTDDNNSIFEDDINRLAEAGITKGCGGTNFCPKSVVDRGQMAAFLVRAFGLTDDGGGDLFVDDDDSIFEGDIDRLGTEGITRGCNPPTNDRFCPDLSVDRGAMAAFLHRAPSP